VESGWLFDGRKKSGMARGEWMIYECVFNVTKQRMFGKKKKERKQEVIINNDPNVYLCTCIGVYTFNTFDIQLEKHLFNT
jgi:hypothetical protein